MFAPEPVQIVGYDKGIPVTRITRHGGGTFVELYSTEMIYRRAVYRGGGARGSRAEEDEVLASLEPVRADGSWWLTVSHRVTSLIGASVTDLREAIAQVDDERAPRLDGTTLDTLPHPTLACEEWQNLWLNAVSSATLVLSEWLEADVPAVVREAVIRGKCGDLLLPEPTANVRLMLPSNVGFAMGLQPDGQFMYRAGLPATHLPVLRKGLPRDRFISGMLELRTRILDSDCQARDLLAAATGRLDDTSVLLEAEEDDMTAALLAVRATDSRDARAGARLEDFEPPWGQYAAGLR
jgi:hypothetical protein